MSRLDLEYFYLSGLPIDVRHKGLGVIRQPKLIDYINRGMEMSTFSHPFVLDKEMIINKNEEIEKALEDVGGLKFLSIYNELTKESNKERNQKGIIELLIDSLSLLYDINDINDFEYMSTLPAIVIKSKGVLITDDNFSYLAKLVVEMLRIDIEEMRKRIREERKLAEQEENEDPLLKRFREMEKKFKEKTGKNEENSFFDLINVVVHGQELIDYDRVFNMTVYQLKNSYNTIIKKEVYNVSLMHRTSPNFQPTEDFKLWEEKAHVVKSGLNKE